MEILYVLGLLTKPSTYILIASGGIGAIVYFKWTGSKLNFKKVK